MADRLRIAPPRRGAPETLWGMDRALRAHEVAAGEVEASLGREADRRNEPVHVAVLDVLAAHMPERASGGPARGWLGGPAVPEHAQCHGVRDDDELHLGCWDPATDSPAPWPCPAVRPVLDALGVVGDE